VLISFSSSTSDIVSFCLGRPKSIAIANSFY
jgi:hypothetical protein